MTEHHNGGENAAGASGERERDLALRANVAGYQAADERRYVRGAPHLRQPGLRRLYAALAEEALAGIARAGPVQVLELGAGSGLASTVWFRDSISLTAVDSSASMLGRLAARSRPGAGSVSTVVADARDYLQAAPGPFDVVTHVSMLHHVPDYLDLLRRSTGVLRPGGALLTFQDPLRYDRMPRRTRFAERLCYFAWRAGQGHYGHGLRTRWRRLRGRYDPAQGAADYEEYHVVRGGVDSEAISAQLLPDFEAVRVVPYWSTMSPPLQDLGARLGLRSTFGVLATGRRT